MNNPSLFNAALAGCTGGSLHGSWLTTTSVHKGFRAAVVAFATAIDAAIPTIVGGATTAHVQLLQSICHSVMAQRAVSAATDYNVVASAIAQLFVDLQHELRAGSGVEGDSTALSGMWWVDQAADSTVANGSITNPFASPADALIAAVTAGIKRLTVCIVPGDYSSTVIDVPDISVSFEGKGLGVILGDINCTGDTENFELSIRHCTLDSLYLSLEAKHDVYLDHVHIEGHIISAGSSNISIYDCLIPGGIQGNDITACRSILGTAGIDIKGRLTTDKCNGVNLLSAKGLSASGTNFVKIGRINEGPLALDSCAVSLSGIRVSGKASVTFVRTTIDEHFEFNFFEAVGTVKLDSYSHYYWTAANGILINGALEVTETARPVILGLVP